MSDEVAESSDRPSGPLKWFRTEDERFLERLMLAGALALFGVQLFFILHYVLGGSSMGFGSFLAGQSLVSFFVVVFFVVFLVFRMDNRLKAGSFRLNVLGPPKDWLPRIEGTLTSLGLEGSNGSGSHLSPAHALLLRDIVEVYEVREAGLRIIVEHHPPEKGVKEEETTSIFVCPSNGSDQTRIIRFIEAFDAQGGDERPQLVVWGRGSRRPPTNAGEGFNSSGTLTSDAEEEER